jgi:hypothetical protein
MHILLDMASTLALPSPTTQSTNRHRTILMGVMVVMVVMGVMGVMGVTVEVAWVLVFWLEVWEACCLVPYLEEVVEVFELFCAVFIAT